MIANSGITWEAVGMTVTIIATLGIPMITFVYIFGRRQGATEEQIKSLIVKDAELESKDTKHEEEIRRIEARQAERDRRLYDKIDLLNQNINSCNVGIAEIKGYEAGKPKHNQ